MTAPLVAGSLVLLALAGSAGWARMAVGGGAPGPLALSVSTLALSIGVLTQSMLWVAVATPGRLNLLATSCVAGAVATAGAALSFRFAPRKAGSSFASSPLRPPAAPWPVPASVLAACAAILLGAAWWPFGTGDALAVYGPLARGIAATGELPIGERLYEGYPMLVPMLFAFAEWVSGGPNEYLARFLTAVLAVGAVAGAGWLAAELRSGTDGERRPARAGWLAAALLLSSPDFCRWAVSGYGDIPAGFFLVAAAVFAWRWWRRRDLASALAGGISAGLALWTKSSLLTLLASGPLLLASWWVMDRRGRRSSSGQASTVFARPWRWTHVAAAGMTALLVGAPWYLRNVLVFGFVIPPTVWFTQARHGLGALLVPLDPRRFGLAGGAAAVFLLVAARRALLPRARPADALFAAAVLPFVAAWWWFASYDPRFLVTLLPLAAGFGGGLLDEGLERITKAGSAATRTGGTLLAATLVVGILAAARQSVEHKKEVLLRPLMNDLARHRVQVGGLHELGLAIGKLPAEARVSGVPAMARFYIAPSRLGQITWGPSGSGSPAGGYTYAASAPPGRGERPEPPAGRLVFRSEDGYTLREIPR